MFQSLLSIMFGLILFISATVVGDEVYYIADRPVCFTSTLLVDLQQHFPSLTVNGKIDQKVKGEISVVSEEPQASLFALPYTLSFVLKDMHIDLCFNGDKSSQNIKNPGTSLFLAQIGEIVNKPIQLRLGADRLIHDEAGILKKVLKENPTLSSLSLNNFFNDLLELPFALAGEKLHLGKEFHRKQFNEFGSQDLIFQIIALNAKTVTAKVKGEVPIHKVDRFGLLFKGRCEGMITWSRANPLICATDMHYHYEAEVEINDGFGTMEYYIQHKVVADGMAAP